MPCIDCEKKEDENIRVYLKFTGGPHRIPAERGPFNSFETGKVYRVVSRMADLPFWEATDEEPEVVADPPFLEEEPEEQEVTIEVEDDPPLLEPSGGITRKFNGMPPSEADFFAGMDDETLKRVIELNGGKVDGRWKRDRLIKEALKLQ